MKKYYTEIVLRWDTGEEVASSHYYSNETPIMFGGGGNEGGGGGSQSTTTVQKADPWEGQQPFLRTGFNEAQRLYNDGGPTFYPGSTTVPFSPETQLAQSMTRNRAILGSPIQDAANNQLTSTLSGDYLSKVADIYNNPTLNASDNLTTNTLNGDYLYGGQGFDRAVQAATNKILPQIDSTFERAGRTGSGLAQQAKTSAIADAFAGQYGQERQNQIASQGMALNTTNSLASQLGQERTNQLRAMVTAPTVANQDYNDIAQLANVGAQQEGQDQAALNENINRYNYGQNLPMAKLQDFMNSIQGSYGGTTSTLSQQPLYQNEGAGMLGGLLTGGSLLSSMGMFGGGGGGMLSGLFGGGSWF